MPRTGTQEFERDQEFRQGTACHCNCIQARNRHPSYRTENKSDNSFSYPIFRSMFPNYIVRLPELYMLAASVVTPAVFQGSDPTINRVIAN